MATALEQLKQGTVVQTDALEKLRMGTGESFFNLATGLGTQTSTPMILPQKERGIVRTIGEAIVPRVVEAVDVAKKEGIGGAAKKFFDPREALKFKEQRLAKREGELVAEGKAPEEAKKIAEYEELTFMAMGAVSPLKVTTKFPSVITKLTSALREAGPIRAEQEALFTAERARRAARAAAIGEKVPGEKGFFAQLGQLKGPLPKAQFEAVRSKFNQPEIDSLFDAIEQTQLLPFEKISAKGGLANLFDGSVPTKGEISLLREVFPEELINQILAKRPLSTRIWEKLGQVFNIPRTMLASVDLSAPFRQGIYMIGRPKQFVSAFKDMFKFAFSERAYQGLNEGIRARPTYPLMRKAQLSITELGSQLSTREERIMSSLPESFPLIGRVIRASNRAYTGFLNKLRADVFDDIIRKTSIVGKELTNQELTDLGRFINAGTGRGNLPSILKGTAPALNAAFFSPRLLASRINLLNPHFYISLSPVVRKEALRTLFATSGILGSILAIAKFSGQVEVGADPRSADFGKIKIGNTRYDVLGGFQQYIKLAAQLISGEIVSSTSGRTITLGEGYRPLTRREIAFRFFESKESPIASFVTAWLQGETAIGREFDMPAEVINRFIPMVIQDMYDISQERGAEGILMGIPAIFGVGAQTYGKQELVKGESKIGEPTIQVRPVPELGERIRELVLGELPLGTSRGFSVETYFDQLSALPRNEAATVFDEIAEANPDLAKKIFNVVKERELGITIKDKDLKVKGVASGDRALAIKAELDKLKTKEGKAALWADYVKKGIITKEIARQLMKKSPP